MGKAWTGEPIICSNVTEVASTQLARFTGNTTSKESVLTFDSSLNGCNDARTNTAYAVRIDIRNIRSDNARKFLRLD